MQSAVRQSDAPYDAKAIANLFLDWAEAENIPVSPMKLQKLLYFCHAESLRARNVPLIKQCFEAWEYGPVIPNVYKEFQKYSKSVIRERAYRFDPITAEMVVARCQLGESDALFIKQQFDFYKSASAVSLSDLSHARNGPWWVAKQLFDRGDNPNNRIADELICRFHQPAHLT